MKVPPNLLRSQAEDFEHTPNHLSTRQLERGDRILATGCHLLALHGLRNLRICDLAIAMNISSAAIRFHFADLDALLIEILHQHFKKINEAIGTVDQSEPEPTAKRRAAYLAATRGAHGNVTEAHLLLIRDAAMLSDINYAAIQQSHEQHALILAGKLDADTVLTILDAPRLDPLRILATFATLEGTDPALLVPLPVLAAPQPAPQQPGLEPERAWSDDLAHVPDAYLQTYPDGQTPGAWVFNKHHARSPPTAA